jgi:hypothetical protein
VTLHSLADTPVTVEVEAHRGSGALVPLAGQASQTIDLEPGQQRTYLLVISEETSTAWVKIRERIPPARTAPAVALSGTAYCRSGDGMQTASRDVAYPTKNPWFSGDVAELRGAVITLINTSERPALASACYSSGTLYFMPGRQSAPDLLPVCSATTDVQIPPFGTREFPVERGGNSHFALKTRGDSIVLQMLRPGEGVTRLFTVDSSIRFGEEVPGR